MIGALGRSERSRSDRRTFWYSRYSASQSHPNYQAPPFSEDLTGKVSNYTYLGNDTVGCCTRACYGHIIQQRCALINEPCTLQASDVLQAYKDGTGWDGVPGSASDRGGQIIDALVQMKNVGMGGYKIRQFGRVNHHDTIEMRAALHLFGSIIVGADLPAAIWRQNTNWDVNPPGSRKPDEAPRSAGGHAFILTGHQYGQWMSMPWITKTSLSYAWDDLYIDEAWFVIDDLWVTANRNAVNGFDLERLQHDAEAIAR